jgi:hypothetical protein
MTTQTTTNLSDSVRAQYVAQYIDAAYNMRLYDMYAEPVGGISMAEAIKGSSVVLPYIGSLAPATTAISQTADLTPVVLEDTTASITPTSRANALSWAEAVDIQAYTDYGAARYRKLGENMMESIDLLAQAAALQGSWVERGAARASLDAGTPAHRASDSIFRKFQGMLATLKVPGWRDTGGQPNWAATMHPFPFHDICESGNIDAIGLYQDMGIHLNFEQAKVGPFRLVVSPWAKVFGGAGVDNATAVADTLASAAAALDKTYVTSSDDSTNVAVGLFWNIGTEETGSTFYATNERVKNLSASTVTITFTGSGENGGFRFAHAASEAVNNNDSVYTVLFGGPQSLKKVHVPGWEFGTTVGPKVDGLVDQFGSLGWKFYGGYGRPTENTLLRFECSTSYEA